MKKLLGIGTALMLALVLVAVPVLADGPGWGGPPSGGFEFLETEDLVFDEVEIEDLFIMSKEYQRDDVITNNAFYNVEGITTVQLSAGNANVLETNVDITTLALASDLDLSAQEIEIEDIKFLEKEYSRSDVISGHAFQGATGITTVNMSSGNANVLQANIGVNIGGMGMGY
ncbi:MAG: hypothetical protein U5K53_00010 [Halanaerobiales bacterium]|nr:hypothetical protein [Halanaerobiales bacterium]